MDVGGNIKTLNYWTYPDIDEFINQKIVLVRHNQNDIIAGVLRKISFKIKHRRETAYINWIDIERFDGTMMDTVSLYPESMDSDELFLFTIRNYDEWLLENIKQL